MKSKIFDSKPVFSEKYVEIEMKSYNKKNNNTGKVPMKGFKYLCLSATVLDSVLKSSKNYYAQTFLEQCKYK